MKSKQTQFILGIIGVVIIIAGIGFLTNTTKAPGKYDEFAKTLSSNGAKFYGAFWCPHCQAQKAEFGSSKKYLPYIECSTPDGQSQLLICTENKIEGYPAWTFKNGITLKVTADPVVCTPKPGIAGESDVCKKLASSFYKTWIFPEYQNPIKSPLEPVKTGNIWKFGPEAQVTGEVPLSFLAEQINFVLPK